ncbi:hypothetical protein D9M68_582000 [compost metagenome]
MQGLQPLDDLRRNVLELVDQQVVEGRQGLGGHAIAAGQDLPEALEGGVEGHQPLLLEQGFEVLPELHQGLDEGAFPRRAGQLASLQLVEADADALHEAGLHMEGLEQRYGGELAGQPEAVQRCLGNLHRLAFGGFGQGRQVQQAVHLFAEIRLGGVAGLVGLLQQALLGRAQAAGEQGVVQFAGAGIVQLLEPARVVQHLLGQGAHGRVEGAYALARLGRIEGELPEGQDLQQLLAQLGAGGVGEGDDGEPLRRHAHVAEHEHHAQHQGGGLAGAGTGEDAGERGAAEDHRPLFVGRRADHPGGDGLADALAHGLDLRVIDAHLHATVDTLYGRFARFGGRLAGGLLRAARPGLAGGGLLCPRLGLLQLRSRFALGAQVFGGAREVTRQGPGQQRLVAFHGRQHRLVPVPTAKR